MRLLLATVLLAALAWGGWWWWHASMREAAVEAWLADRRAAGWTAEASEVRVIGFPNRIDTIVTGLDLADPEAGWSWKAPEFQILSLSWKPHHIVAAWPGEHVVATGHDTVRVTGAVLRGSVVFVPSPGLALDRATIEVEGLSIASDSGWRTEIDRAILATRRAGEGPGPFPYDVSFTAEALQPPRQWAERIDRGDILPPAIEALALDAVLGFDRPWDRAAVEGATPAIEAVRLRDASLDWGALDLSGRGEVVADADGRAEGSVDLRARNWRRMLELAEDAGALGAGVAEALGGGLGLIALLTGDENTIDLPLTFEDGRTRLGPVELGAAPRLTRR